MASVSYMIEGPSETLKLINDAIVRAMSQEKHWDEWEACINLGFTEEELDGKRLGGEFSDEPSISENILEFYAEERWGLQDFNELLEKKFPEIKVYWIVEESGCEVYATNDKDGKYFPERFYAELCQDDQIDFEYFKTEEAMYKWLSEKTDGRVHNEETVEQFNSDYEDEALDDENYIIIHQYAVMD